MDIGRDNIAEEGADDIWEIEALYDLAFAPGRTALSSYRLRDGVAPVGPLGLHVRDGYGVIVGAIRQWPARVVPTTDGAGPRGGWPTLLLGPIAVHPTRQGEGLGGLLMGESLGRAAALGWRRVLLVGDLPYYRRFGFAVVSDRIAFPPPTNPNRILGRALAPGGLDGVAGLVTRWEGPTPDAGPPDTE